MSVVVDPPRSLADISRAMGNIPKSRIRLTPRPGSATVADAERFRCELVDGTLVEKAMGVRESALAGFLQMHINLFVIPRDLGFTTGEQGFWQVFADFVRAPDVSFVSWNRLPGRRRPTVPIPALAPDLGIEVLSMSNTPGEMARKRSEYFRGGMQHYWEIDPRTRTAAVYTSETDVRHLTIDDVLDGETVLPGFALPLADVFGEDDRNG